MDFKLVVFYRIEHAKCDADIHHGPQGTSKSSDLSCTHDVPFGSNGPIPQNDYPFHFMDPSEKCGVLRDQLPRWWSIIPPPESIAGWEFAVYYSPEYYVKILRRQIIFNSRRAMFLGYFPGWVDHDGYLDGRYPDWEFERKAFQALHKPDPRLDVRGPTNYYEPNEFPPSPIDPTRTESIRGDYKRIKPRFLLDTGSWTQVTNYTRCF